MQLLGDLGERAGGVAVCLGAAIDQKNLHHKLPLLLVTSAEDYRTREQMAWSAMRNGLCFTSRPTTLVQFGARYLHRLFNQRIKFVQNGNGLSVDGVKMKRRHAKGRLIFK